MLWIKLLYKSSSELFHELIENSMKANPLLFLFLSPIVYLMHPTTNHESAMFNAKAVSLSHWGLRYFSSVWMHMLTIGRETRCRAWSRWCLLAPHDLGQGGRVGVPATTEHPPAHGPSPVSRQHLLLLLRSVCLVPHISLPLSLLFKNFYKTKT